MPKLKSVKFNQKESIIALTALSFFLIVAGYFIFSSRAAQPAASIEATNPVAPAVSYNDSSASLGNAVEFKAAATTTNYPNANNTGWRPVVSQCPNGQLVKYEGNRNVSQLTGNGGTINCAEITGNLCLDRTDVKINKSWIYGKVDVTRCGANGRGVIITDTEIGGPDPNRVYANNGIGDNNFTLRRVNLHNFSDGARVNGNVLVEDSFIHTLMEDGDNHKDGLQITEGDNVTIRRNTVENRFSETGAITIGADQGDINNLVVDNNLISGGGAAMYGGKDPYVGTLSNVTITNNYVSTKFFANGGRYGSIVCVDLAFTTYSNNRWYDGPKANQIIPPPSECF